MIEGKNTSLRWRAPVRISLPGAEPQLETGGINNDAANPPPTGEPNLVIATRAFISQVKWGKNFDERSLKDGTEISRQIERGFVTWEAVVEQGSWRLIIEHGNLLNSYKAYAEYHNLPWEKFADKSFPHLKKRKRQDLMFVANHPEVAECLYMGFDRALRLYRAGKKFDRRDGMKALIKRYSLIWDPNGTEPLMDFRMRVDRIINEIMAERTPVDLSPKKLIENLRKWMEEGTNLLQKIISHKTAPGRLEISDIEPIEKKLNQLRETIEQAG